MSNIPGWDENGERARRGLPTAKEQALNGLAPGHESAYAQLIADRQAARRAYTDSQREQRQKAARVLNVLAKAGINGTYQRGQNPSVVISLDDADQLSRLAGLFGFMIRKWRKDDTSSSADEGGRS